MTPFEFGPLEFGQVVLVPFPFTNQTVSKQRPAVVVSSRAYGWLRQWQGAGLLKPSAVKPVIATLEQGLVIRQLGELDTEDQAALRAAIGQIIG